MLIHGDAESCRHGSPWSQLATRTNTSPGSRSERPTNARIQCSPCNRTTTASRLSESCTRNADVDMITTLKKLTLTVVSRGRSGKNDLDRAHMAKLTPVLFSQTSTGCGATCAQAYERPSLHTLATQLLNIIDWTGFNIVAPEQEHLVPESDETRYRIREQP